MTTFSRVIFCFSALSFITPFLTDSVQAEDSFDHHVHQLADDNYAVRVAAVEALVRMCKKKPALLDKLVPIIANPNEEVERRLNAREVAAKSLYTERGAIGFTLDRELFVINMVDNGPAKNSGIPMYAQLLSVSGKSIKDKQPAEVNAMVHATKPGTKLEMVLIDHSGAKRFFYPVVARRSTIRCDEYPEKRRERVYKEWMKLRCQDTKTN